MFIDVFGIFMLLLTLLVVVLVVFISFRALSMRRPLLNDKVIINKEKADECAEKLSKMIKVDTVWGKDERFSKNSEKFWSNTKNDFPNFFKMVEEYEFGKSKLFHLKSEYFVEPVILMAHYDVAEVVEEGDFPLFLGHMDEQNVYGRGAIDSKGSLCAILQSFEDIITQGEKINRDVMIISLADEERDSSDITKIVAWFKSRNAFPSLVLDEGGFILDEPYESVSGKFAMLGLSERSSGKLLIKARRRDDGKGSMLKIASFIQKASARELGRPSFSPETKEMFNKFLPFMELPQRVLFSNMWLFKNTLRHYAPKVSPRAKAMILPTISFYCVGDEVLKTLTNKDSAVYATLMCNAHHNIDDAIDKLHKLACDCDVELAVMNVKKAPNAEHHENEWYKRVAECVCNTFPDTVASPTMIFGNTAGRHFVGNSECVIRFSPFYLNNSQFVDFHGPNERITKESLGGAVAFYTNLIKAL